ncbi:Ferritin-like protein [Dioscorea alata]|uniref:Ferritin-like protein n=1 Tax=Dioscorea alata TaxID=55571 RepID=A0ACB7TX50_DIOAL|nr:Ferritin-like protein [Dioscorea alata]
MEKEKNMTTPAAPSPAPQPELTLVEASLRVLNTADPVEKARLGESIARKWLQGSISLPFRPHDPPPLVPDRPSRLPNVKLVPSRLMPKLGKGGSLQSRQAIVHSLVHTESWAIDLSWDIIARFGIQESMPMEFFTDFVKVAQDEGRHFSLLLARLEELGSYYGAFPAHDGLWDSAIQTSHDLLARLAVEHCVHEARGLDVLPTTISRLRNGGDECTAKLLETVIYPEEITHCAAGVKWFRYLCLRSAASCPNNALAPLVSSESPKAEEDTVKQLQISSSIGDSELVENLQENSESLNSEDTVVHHDAVIQTFHATVRKYFRGPLKPPFNVQARKAAGFGPDWYEPLAVKQAVNVT